MIKLIKLLAGITISCLALAYFIYSTPNNILDAFFHHRMIILIGFAILTPVYLLRVLKYYLILNSHQVNFERLAGAQLVGIALNNLLPFRMGDILRTGYIYKILEVPIKDAIISLFIERGIDLGTILLLLLGFGVLFYPNDIIQILSTFRVPFIILFTLFLILALVGLYLSKVKKFSLPFPQNIKYFWPHSLTNTIIISILAMLQWFLEIIILGLILSWFIFWRYSKNLCACHLLVKFINSYSEYQATLGRSKLPV